MDSYAPPSPATKAVAASRGEEYSTLKAAWWMLRDGGLPPVPKQAQIILSDLCNQDCAFCAYRMDGYTSNQLFTEGAELSAFGHNNPKRMIPKDRALSLLEELKDAGVLGIQFTGGGEPTVHPDHRDIFRRALTLGFKCSLVSNGINWNKDIFDILRAFSWVRVSLDAGTPETYARIRRSPAGHFNRALLNIRTLAYPKTECVIGVGFVATPDNWREIPQAAWLARINGATNIRISAAFTPTDEADYVDIYDDIRTLIHETRLVEEVDGFKVIDRFGDRIADLRLKQPDYPFCGYQHFTTYIGADLRPYRCCVYAYNERGIIANGSLANRRFDEFWASEERKADFATFDPKQCQRCQFNPINRTIAYLSKEEIQHKEFP